MASRFNPVFLMFPLDFTVNRIQSLLASTAVPVPRPTLRYDQLQTVCDLNIIKMLEKPGNIVSNI